MQRNMKEWMYGIYKSDIREVMPVLTFPGLEITKKGIVDIVTKGEAQYECIKAVSDKYPSAAAVTVMDLSVEAEAFGSPVTFSTSEPPSVKSRIVHDMDSAMSLRVPKVGEGRTGEYIKAAELAAAGIKDRPVFGGMIGPFSLAGRLFDITEIMMAMVLEPETVNLLLEKCTEFLCEYARAFKKAGVNGIIIAEPAAGLISPQHCDEFSSVYVKKIVDAVQDKHFMVILHNCGNTEKLVDSMLSTGAMGLHFGNAVDMTRIMPQIPWGRIGMGNIDPAGVMRNGAAQEVRDKTWSLLENTAVYKNFVLSTGCDVPYGTPLQNVDEFYNTLNMFNNSIMLGDIA